MSLRLKPYPKIKGSGVPWLGQVPEHWDVVPNRALFAEVNDRDHPDEQMLSVTITRGVIPQKELLTGSSKKDGSNQDKSAYKLVCPGELAYNKMRAWQGAIGVSDLRGIVSPAYVVVRLRDKNCGRYFHQLFRTPQFAKEAERWSYGITSDMWSLRPEHFRMIYCVLPPYEEQAAIVRFLDHADKRIRRFIAVKRRLIELLNEQKQAIIQKAVTRGLDPNVRLKPSGIEWLGEVPEHWGVVRLKYLFREVDKRSTNGTEVLLSLRMWRGLVPHTEVSNIPIGSTALVGFKRVAPGQVVMNRMRASIGLFGTVPQEGLVSPDYAVFEPIGAISPDYFVHLFKTRGAGTIFRIESKGLGTGSAGFMRLYTDRFGIIKVPLPPLDEQRGIVQYIAEGTEEIDRLVNRANREIALVREYRTRLIADVVTGKLDVRGVELPPLEEAEKLPAVGDEALDEAAEEETELEPVEEGADAAD